MLDFGRELCSQLPIIREREWLVTNGLGGFAMGTVAGMLTRRYHGLLIAALAPPLGRKLLLAKLDETLHYDGQAHPLYTNHWTDDVVEPDGYTRLERFRLEGTTPVWTYLCGDARLEKRVWMAPGANTTYCLYTLLDAAAGPVTLELRALGNYRDYHATTILNDWQPALTPVDDGLAIEIFDGAQPYYLYAAGAEMWPQHDWYEDFYLSQEEYRGQKDVVDDHLYLAFIRATLSPGASLTIVATTDVDAERDGDGALAQRRAHEARLAAAAPPAADTAVRHFVLAADQFVVKRVTPETPDGYSIIAGYPWFGDWGRDTMIALPGLTLSTGRPEVATAILRTFARFVDRGMLPNRFPDDAETPAYNTVDATLWYFEALRAYHAATDDDALLADLFPILQSIIDWHQRGTRYRIKVAEDGLLFAGEPGTQLTWMDAKVDDWVVTPRIGKAVEVNALWYNALSVMADFAGRLGHAPAPYERLAARARAGFERFWHAAGGYCYDVIDGPEGNDAALRPNQLLAVSLPHSPLDRARQRAVVDVCQRYLLTSHGLRSLAPGDSRYHGRYGGDVRARDGAYHQGTVWSWLIGPFVDAHLRVYGDRTRARAILAPLVRHLAGGCIGSVSEIFDGDRPFTPRGCPAQAWGVAELLRLWPATHGQGVSSNVDNIRSMSAANRS